MCGVCVVSVCGVCGGSGFCQHGQALDKSGHGERGEYSDCKALKERRHYESAEAGRMKLQNQNQPRTLDSLFLKTQCLYS